MKCATENLSEKLASDLLQLIVYSGDVPHLLGSLPPALDRQSLQALKGLTQGLQCLGYLHTET